MIKRRALIVDDSRSARQILGRMLESFALEVDQVESAELALGYLQTARPDVIFMDHLMSGMDGFSAVRLLKANPDTATIPVLMYTSQEGEMYLSQARSLGAVGVLPKTLKHADVAEALQQLNLLDDNALSTAAATSVPSLPAPARPASTSVVVMSTVTEQDPPAPRNHKAAHPELADLSPLQLSHRIASEVKAELTQSLQPPPTAPRSLLSVLVSGGTVVFLLLVLAVLGYWQYQAQLQLTHMQKTQQELLSLLQAPPAQVATSASSAATSSAAASVADWTTAPIKMPTVVRSESEAVEYGEIPFSGARLEHLRNLVDALRAQAFKGTLRVEEFTGDFCLQGNASDGYHLADDEIKVPACDLLGNPFSDALSVPQRQSLAFANYVANVNSPANATSGLRIQLGGGGRQLVSPYPRQSSTTLTAGEWNRIAARNHRVEYRAIANYSVNNNKE